MDKSASGSSSIHHDAHGQPVTTRLRKSAIQSRNIDELIGICRGISFDNQVTQSEAEHLFSWLHSQPELVQVWPANILYHRLTAAFADGVIDQREAKELLNMLRDVTGRDAQIQQNIDVDTGELLAEVSATVLPTTEPAALEFIDRNFVLTGKFASGTRDECQAEVLHRGGKCQGNPTRRTHYLVIGAIGSRDWAHSTWGRKIEKAVELRSAGCDLQILTEEYWSSWLQRI